MGIGRVLLSSLLFVLNVSEQLSQWDVSTTLIHTGARLGSLNFFLVGGYRQKLVKSPFRYMDFRVK